MKLGFGKYRDLELCDVPEDYLLWLIRNSEDKIKLYKTELERRESADDANASWMERVVKAGWRELTKKHHPDIGGSTADQQEINAAYEKLRRYCK